MSVDFQQVKKQVVELGAQAPQRAQVRENRRLSALQTLQDFSERLDELRDKISQAAALNANLRSAVPVSEALRSSFPLPPLPERASLLAADGSQIFPDRHGSIFYSLVNVGAISMLHGSGAAPALHIESSLLYDDKMYTDSGQITERIVALMRDLGERELLARLAREVPAPVLTFTDGPLELWDAREGGESQQIFEDNFKKYLAALHTLHALGASTAGYIDKPGGDLVVRMLEIALLNDRELSQAGKVRPFLGLTDVDLLRDLIPPDHRSALFAIRSATSKRYAEELALHFFYLHVGSTSSGKPYLARVEIPAWVADSPAMVNDLHALLIHQCRAMGSRPYPYLLHRSHETALVSRAEKDQVDAMIDLELRKHGVEVGPASFKSESKQAGGRRRHKD